MRRIDKSAFQATVFIDSIEKYELDQNGNHPPYDKSAFRNTHYTNVFLALLTCQKGICAYTESELYRDFELLANDWEGGIYKGNHQSRKGFRGTIDHFDSDLTKSKGWQLNNLFLVHNDVNTDKGTKPVFQFLNPGNEGYSPNDYLFYSYLQHMFYPKEDLQDELKKNVRHMINVFGLNAPSIISEIKGYLNSFKIDIKSKIKSLEQILGQHHYKFYTAFEMSIDGLQE